MEFKKTIKRAIMGGTIVTALGLGVSGCSFNANNPASIGERWIVDLNTGKVKAADKLFAPKIIKNESANYKLEAMLSHSSEEMRKYGKIKNIIIARKKIDKENAQINYTVKFEDGHVSNNVIIDFKKINGKWYIYNLGD